MFCTVIGFNAPIACGAAHPSSWVVMRIHLVIPDCQVKPNVPIDHLHWIGKYIVDQFAGDELVIVCLGDFWDMPSLSSYDRGKKAMEGRRYVEDIRAGAYAWDTLTRPLAEYNHLRQARHEKQWWPERHFLFGNHEHRITRAAEDNAQLDGLVSLEHLRTPGWQQHEFLEVVDIDGIAYSHFFYNPMTGRPYAGSNLETRLKTVGRSFTMGHQQGLKWGRVDTTEGPHIGLVAGSCYLHDETYLGPQGNDHWRGVVVCHQVEKGDYDPMMVSLDYLCRKYEGVRLGEYVREMGYAA